MLAPSRKNESTPSPLGPQNKLNGLEKYNQSNESIDENTLSTKGALAIRRIFSLVDMITKPKFSNCPYVFKIGLFR